jgi:hypothetical protein
MPAAMFSLLARPHAGFGTRYVTVGQTSGVATGELGCRSGWPSACVCLA